jgi:sugar/nucleoside kinase (ribokinase family)
LAKNLPEDVRSFLRQETETSVVVMPDFFLDRLVTLDCELGHFSQKLASVAEQKGGSIDGLKQLELRGGNAVNTASALIELGAKVTPIVCTNDLGHQLTRFYLRSERADLSHIKIFRDLSITTALEFKTEIGKVNVMLRDIGALRDFGPENLSCEDFESMKSADYVCVFNWAGTRSLGTKLAQTVFSYVKQEGRGKTYYDTADPSPVKEGIPDLMNKVLLSDDLDILSVNENEATWYAAQLSDEIEELRKRLTLEELAKESARILASHLSARIDLHTTEFSATFRRKKETIVPGFQIEILRATGAGDSWNAGNILGDACRLSDIGRLTLANAVAAYYVSNHEGKHPNRGQLMKFCEKQTLKNDTGVVETI